MKDIGRDWPEGIDLRPIRTPFRILQEQVWAFQRSVGGAIRVRAMHNEGDYDDPMPFQSALVLDEGKPVDELPVSYTVLRIRHGIDLYPVEVMPGGEMIQTESDFIAYLQERLAAPDVRQAIRILASIGSPEIYCESLLPESYDLRPIRTPYRILLEQAWAIKDKTNGLVIGELNTEQPREESLFPRFCYSLQIRPSQPWLPFFSPFYKVLEIEHGLELYPVVVRPGNITLKSED